MRSKLVSFALVFCFATACSSGVDNLPPKLPSSSVSIFGNSHATSTVLFSLVGGVPASGPAHSVRSLTITPYGSNGKTRVWNLSETVCSPTQSCSIRMPFYANPTFVIRSYNKTGGAGGLLSTTIVSKAVYGFDQIGLTLNPSVQQAGLDATDVAPAFGKSEEILLAGVARDAFGNYIIGPAPYSRAIALQNSGNMRISSTKVTDAIHPVTLEYNGGYEYARVALASKSLTIAFGSSDAAIVHARLAKAAERTSLDDASQFGLAAASDGTVWLADSDKCALARIRSNLTTSQYALATSFACPTRVITGPGGNVWFSADAPSFSHPSGANGIGYVTSSGVITGYPAGEDVGPIAKGPDGKLWVVDGITGNVYSATTSGVYTKAAFSLGVPYVRDIIAGPDGNLWIPYDYDGKQGVAVVSTAGTLVKRLKTKAVAPWAVRGKYLYAVTAGGIGKFDAAGSLKQQYPSAEDTSSPSQFARRSDGSLWYGIAVSSAGIVLGRISSAGSYCEVVVPLTSGDTSSPILGLIFGPDGDLYYTRSQYSSYLGKIVLPKG